MMYGAQGLSALDTALWGMQKSSDWLEASAQKVALAGTESMSPDRVTLSNEALRTLEGSESIDMQDALIDLGVAKSLYTANAGVVEVLVELDKALLGLA